MSSRSNRLNRLVKIHPRRSDLAPSKYRVRPAPARKQLDEYGHDDRFRPLRSDGFTYDGDDISIDDEK